MPAQHKYFPTGNANIRYSGGVIATTGLSSSGLSADKIRELDRMVTAGILRTDLPGGGVSSAATFDVAGYIPVLGTPSTDEMAVPQAGTLIEVAGVSNAAGGTADAIITVKNLTQSKTCCTVTFASDYPGHTRIGSSTISNADFADNDVLSFDCDGGGSGAGSAHVVATFQIP